MREAEAMLPRRSNTRWSARSITSTQNGAFSSISHVSDTGGKASNLLLPYVFRSLTGLIFLPSFVVFFTCSLAVSLVLAHLAVLLAVAEPLQRDAEVVVTLELVVSTAFLAASLQPNTIKAPK